MIERVTVFQTKGKSFDTFKGAVDHRENLVDEFFSHLPGFYEVPLKKRTEFIQAVLDRRSELKDLLDFNSKRAAGSRVDDDEDE